MKEVKSGLHLGDRPVTKDPERGARAVTWSVLASLLLVRWYGHDQGLSQEGSRLKRKERVAAEVAPGAVMRTALTWQRFTRFKPVASCPYAYPSLLRL